MPRIRFTDPGRLAFTGVLGQIAFKDGVSGDEPLRKVDALAAAFAGLVLVDADGVTVLGPAGRLVRDQAVGRKPEVAPVATDTRVADLDRPVKTITAATYTLKENDAGSVIDFTTGCTITIPASLGIGFQCSLRQGGYEPIKIVNSPKISVEDPTYTFRTKRRQSVLQLAQISPTRYMLTETLAASPVAASTSSVNGFSRLKAKLVAGQNAMLLVHADSTGWSKNGPFYKLAAFLGERYNVNVKVRLWQEWAVTNLIGALTGPMTYGAAEDVYLASGSGRPTLDIYLLAIPSMSAGAIFDARRRPAAIDTIPTPDCIVIQHGHNQQSFEMPGDILSGGAGLFLGPIGMLSMRFPGVPMVLTTQNPWRDNTNYQRVYNAIKKFSAAMPSLTVIDTYAAFEAVGKSVNLYLDNIHPTSSAENSVGSQLTLDVIIPVWDAATPDLTATTVSWPTLAGTNLLGADIADWTAALPANYANTGAGVTVSKDTANVYPGFAHCMSVLPNGSTGGTIRRTLTATERAAVLGKTVSLAVLVKDTVRASGKANNFYAAIVAKSGGATRTLSFTGLQRSYGGWMWFVVSGLPIDADSPAPYINLVPNFFAAAVDNQPLLIQKMTLVEGELPMGGLA